MGLLNDFATTGLNILGVNTQPGIASPFPFGKDFPDGMLITEVIDRKDQTLDSIQLVGRFAPLQPFEFGGEQRIVREEYPGTSEPTIQVLGPKEEDVAVKIEMRTNKFRGDPALRAAAQEYQELIDAMRLRGNLVRIQLGEWKRYGFIKRCRFRVFTLQKIDAEITFEIVGFNHPKGWRVVTESDENVIKPNKEVTNAAAAALANAKNYPETMPLTAVDIFNNSIGAVGDAISKVTGFVEGIVDDADKLVGSANRAIGLIKNARATISRAKRNIGAIANNASGLAGSAANASQGAINLIKNTDHTTKTIRDFSNLSILLAALQARFQSYVSQVPFRRHLVRQGDTLQNISMKYYNTADNWKKIYDHNKLSETDLVIGSILEIPRV